MILNDFAADRSSGDEGKVDGPGIFAYSAGIPVVVNKNTNTSLGLVNGKEGVAVNVVIDPTSSVTHIAQDVWVVSRPPRAILISFPGDMRHKPIEDFEANVLPIFPQPVGHVEIKDSKGIKVAVARTQVPVTPAFAITDYKCQGRTFERIAVDFETTRNCFGQKDYASITVPLSRVKTLSGLSLIRGVRSTVFLK